MQRAGVEVMASRHSEGEFETIIEAHLLAHGYIRLDREGFDRERTSRTGGVKDLQPYCHVAVWFLHQRLAAMERRGVPVVHRPSRSGVGSTRHSE